MEPRIIFEDNAVRLVDILVIDAHPDDAEICCGGSIAKITNEGGTVGVIDCTRGEMGTRGNPDLRLHEALNATKILGISHRINLGMVDGFIEESPDALYQIITYIRRFRPKIIITHPAFERHPDHEAVHKLVRNAIFKSGLKKIHTEFEDEVQDVYRTRKIFCFMQSYQFDKKADFFVDISEYSDVKMKAIEAFSSQVFVEGNDLPDEPKTRLSTPDFKEELVARSRYFGGLVGVQHAEAYQTVEPLALRSLSAVL